MIKCIVSIICASIILFAGAVFENIYVQNNFNDFHSVLEVLYQKVDEQVALEDDVYAVQQNWLSKKKVLHAFIPHNEIKEVDLWLSESATLVRDKEWKDAISKIEVLKELAEQIPRTFMITLDNIL